MRPNYTPEMVALVLRCPRCKGPIILHRDGVTCQEIDCGGIFQPSDMGLTIRQHGWAGDLDRLRENFPQLASDRMKPKDLRIKT